MLCTCRNENTFLVEIASSAKRGRPTLEFGIIFVICPIFSVIIMFKIF